MTYLALIVEDANRQYISLESDLKADGWEALRARDKEDCLFRLHSIQEEKKHLDALAVDLGLPPFQDDVKTGLQLIYAVRQLKEYQDLPILAYTSQSNIEYVLYASVVRELLTLRASLLYLRPLESSFANLMGYIRQGFFILSPMPAGYLPSAVPDRPDPLDDGLWETLESLSLGLNHPQAAKRMNISPETIRTRLDKIRQTLIDREEVLPDARMNELLNWYREHMVRFARDEILKKITLGNKNGT